MKTKLIGLMTLATLLTVTAMAPEAMARRGRGADDPAGHVRGEGAGHTSIIVVDPAMQLARRGADDPAGHVRGEGPGHA